MVRAISKVIATAKTLRAMNLITPPPPCPARALRR